MRMMVAMRTLALVVLLLGGCVMDPAEEPRQDAGPVVIVTVPSRLFVTDAGGSIARIDIADGTSVLGVTVRVNAVHRSIAIVCASRIDAMGAMVDPQCSERVALESETPIRVPMREITVGASQRFTLSVVGEGLTVDGGLVALRALPDPL